MNKKIDEVFLLYIVYVLKINLKKVLEKGDVEIFEYFFLFSEGMCFFEVWINSINWLEVIVVIWDVIEFKIV